MKIIKKFTAVLTVTGLLFMSCNNATDTEYKTMEIKIADGQTVEYKVDSEGHLAFNDWDGFNDANRELMEIEERDLAVNSEIIEGLNNSVNNLGNTIPAWLKTEEVLEDIDDVQEEYKKLLDERNEPAKNVKQNLEELNEKFDDLREELNETIEDYNS
ncbi:MULTISPECIES: hypothetical protein [Polaribacter]|uniref:Lipoprotein n=1 Tax=Polaribacter marinaquae TaxID=1642819 RepID=A0ABZ2TMX3_9FLAO|nr:hypothetical protein [Polaribacter sp. KT 15]SHM96091.1 hypothetical protein SAMN05720268_1676 [Polaribacter sp. KT 15]